MLTWTEYVMAHRAVLLVYLFCFQKVQLCFSSRLREDEEQVPHYLHHCTWKSYSCPEHVSTEASFTSFIQQTSRMIAQLQLQYFE